MKTVAVCVARSRARTHNPSPLRKPEPSDLTLLDDSSDDDDTSELHATM